MGWKVDCLKGEEWESHQIRRIQYIPLAVSILLAPQCKHLEENNVNQCGVYVSRLRKDVSLPSAICGRTTNSKRADIKYSVKCRVTLWHGQRPTAKPVRPLVSISNKNQTSSLLRAITVAIAFNLKFILRTFALRKHSSVFVTQIVQ